MIFLFLLIFNYPQSNPAIIGQWSYYGCKKTDGKLSRHYECPDVLEFKSNGQYYIYNDCYGINTENPITQSGLWKVNGNALNLSNTTFTSNYSTYAHKKNAELKVISVGKDTLKVEFNKIIDIYLRVK